RQGRYSYLGFVTHLEMQAWMVWKTYSARANVERSIRELLNYFALNKIPTHEWVANVAFLQLLLFGDNLVHWFKRLCLPQEYLHATVDTIRQEFLVLPGIITARLSWRLPARSKLCGFRSLSVEKSSVL